MRTSTRFGAATAAVALASAAALAGAGAAAAADPPPANFDSDSTLGVAFVDDEVQVEFDNNSGRDLACLLTISTTQVVKPYEDFLRSGGGVQAQFNVDGDFTGVTHTPATPVELNEMITDAIAAGEAGSYYLTIAADASGVVDASDIDVSHPVGSTDFDPAAIAVCGTEGEAVALALTDYPETGETGSLENIFGSAAGSLGSLGS